MIERESLYWDEFKKRIVETISSLKKNRLPEVRRVAVFITNECNLNCEYCNFERKSEFMNEELFDNIINRFSSKTIIHITGGEPSTVPWLYEYVKKHGESLRFHINSNLFLPAPYNSIKRLKVSLDSCNPEVFNKLVHSKKAFDNVVRNISDASEKTVTSVTYTLTKSNLSDAINFVRFTNKTFPKLYAVTFSIYKGDNKDFVISKDEADLFFKETVPELKKELKGESYYLFNEVMDNASQLVNGIRFPELDLIKTRICYLSLSERTFSPKGEESFCSHLYRDKIKQERNVITPRCYYGCAKKLAKFNTEVFKEVICGGANGI